MLLICMVVTMTMYLVRKIVRQEILCGLKAYVYDRFNTHMALCMFILLQHGVTIHTVIALMTLSQCFAPCNQLYQDDAQIGKYLNVVQNADNIANWIMPLSRHIFDAHIVQKEHGKVILELQLLRDCHTPTYMENLHNWYYTSKSRKQSDAKQLKMRKMVNYVYSLLMVILFTTKTHLTATEHYMATWVVVLTLLYNVIMHIIVSRVFRVTTAIDL